MAPKVKSAAPAPAAAPARTAAPARRRLPRLVVAGIVLAGLGTVAAVALPRFMRAEDDTLGPGAVSGPGTPSPQPQPKPQPKPQPGPGEDGGDDAEKKPAAAETVPVREGGDLAVAVSLRWNEVPAGATVPAEIRFMNHGTKAFHVPAQGEPHPTLALVIVDDEGREVRRVVESSVELIPRRTQLVPSGGVVLRKQFLVSATDEPLAPGKYLVHAEYRPDPYWRRLGLPTWTAPNGALRSEIVSLTVLPRAQ